MSINNEFDPIGGDGVPASPDAVPQETSPRLEAERAEFCEWIATAAPFDANVGMVEHAMKTSAAWEGWMARAAAQDFREVLPASMASPGGRHPALPLLPPQHAAPPAPAAAKTADSYPTAPEDAQPAEPQEADTDAIDERIAAAEAAGVTLSEADKDTIRAALTRADDLRAKGDRIAGRASDPMRKGNAFPMGVGFTRMTKRAEQRIDASVRRAGEAVEVFKRANQAEQYADALLAGKGTEADKIRKEAKKVETKRLLVRKLVEWKKGDKIGGFTVEKINKDRDGYPATFTISGEGIVNGVTDKVSAVREFFGGDKDAFRLMVDEVRGPQEAAPAPVEASSPLADSYPITAAGAVEAFNDDNAPQAMQIVAKLKIDALQEVGAAIGFRPQVNETAKAFRERLGGVADKLTKTAREKAARQKALYDKLIDRAMAYDRAADHAERARVNGVPDDSTAYDSFYTPMGGGETQMMRIPAMLDKLAADVDSLRNDPEWAEVAPMVSSKRPRVFEHKPASSPAPEKATPAEEAGASAATEPAA